MILTICAPSGGGKTTQVEMLEAKTDFRPAITVTTRDPRPGETDGVHYYFITRAKFERWKAEGQFAESATVFGHEYGILRQTFIDACEKKTNLILNIDIQGYRTVKNHPDKAIACSVKGIFLMPPSMQDLEDRLRGRKNTNEESIQKRLAVAPAEMASSLEIGFFDAIIVTHDKQSTHEKIMQFINRYSS